MPREQAMKLPEGQGNWFPLTMRWQRAQKLRDVVKYTQKGFCQHEQLNQTLAYPQGDDTQAQQENTAWQWTNLGFITKDMVILEKSKL